MFLGPLLRLLLARPLAMEAVRELSEGLLSTQQAARLVHILEFHVWFVRFQLPEVARHASHVVPVPLSVLLIKVTATDKEHSIH